MQYSLGPDDLSDGVPMAIDPERTTRYRHHHEEWEDVTPIDSAYLAMVAEEARLQHRIHELESVLRRVAGLTAQGIASGQAALLAEQARVLVGR